ncbi:MAG: shikimate kinase [Candidatus Delongbacteria bacterium]
MLITLVGFMACGKSTLGPLMALCLNQPFRDLDACVEARAGRSLAWLFEQEGEEGFRRLERSAWHEQVREFSGVLAVGGGLPCQPGGVEELRAAGPVLFLDPPLDLLLARLQGDRQRPLVTALPEERRASALRELWVHRRDFYLQAGRRVELPAGEDLPRQLDRLLDALGEEQTVRGGR